MENACTMCGKATSGCKCDMCGQESPQHDATHSCGAEHCMAKCASCNEAEKKCACPKAE